jgi:ribonuclease E
VSAENAESAEPMPVRSSYFTLPVEAAPAPVAAPVIAEPAAAVVEPVPVLAPAPAAPAMPAAASVAPSGMSRVQAFELSIKQLQQVAQASGLEWVNSDADKVARVQAAIAAEPKPIHVPREPKPVAVIDEGPLVLVETRKDLSGMKLPFENA